MIFLHMDDGTWGILTRNATQTTPTAAKSVWCKIPRLKLRIFQSPFLNLGWLITQYVVIDFLRSDTPASPLLDLTLPLTQKISNLHYTRVCTPKRVTSCEAHLRDLAPGQHSSEETSQRWRAVGDTMFYLTCPGIEP